MPSEIIDQRGGSASPHFLEEICFPAERQIGFWKQNTVSDHQVGPEGTVPMSGSKLIVSSPLEKFSPIGIPSIDWLELRQSTLARGQMKRTGIGGEEGRNSVNHHPKSWSNLSVQPACYSLSGNRTGMNGIQSESSLFSSSLSDIFSRKLKLPGNDILPYQPFNTVTSHHGEEERFESLEEIEAQTIGNLLPDEDDLFSGVIDDLGHNFHGNTGDELEDFDIFSSGGGMELEGDDRLYAGQKNSDIVGVGSNQGGSDGSVVGEHPYSGHPSRTLFVRNINSNVEDSELKTLFEQYGDIQTIYTACKHRGFVMISYYDIRAARNAMRALQSKPLRRRTLDIHYSIPKDNPSEKDTNQGTLLVFNLDSSVLTDDLRQIFGVYGDIKEIREIPHKRNHKFIEFYDIRAAEAALRALNRSDITGKHIKLEPCRPGGLRCFIQQSEQEQDELNLCQSPFDDLSSGQIVVSSRVITSSCMDNGSIQVLHSAIRSPVSAFTESHQSSSVPNNLPSPARVASIGKQFGLQEPNFTWDEMKFGNQHPSFHPHSVPEYHDSLTNGLSYNSPSTIADIASNVSSKIKEGVDNRHIRGVSSNGHLMEPTGGFFGSPGNGSYSLHGNPYAWNNSNSHQQHPSSPMIWPNSPSLLNGLHANRVPHMPGFPRVPPLLLNTASPVHHHIGSAPAVNPSIWDRQHTFAGEAPETYNFHLGSLGSVGFPGRSPSHPMDIASHDIFSHVGGNCMDVTKNVGLRFPQQMCHVFPGRNPMMSMQTSFDSSNEHVRNLSYRRNESNSNHVDKRQYDLDIDRILRGEDCRTTLMIKNIPNKHSMARNGRSSTVRR